MPRKKVSVLVSRNADLLMSLSDKILQKHYQDGPDSKIPAMLADQLQNKLTIARTEHNRSNELNRLREKLTEERNLILGRHGNQNSYVEGSLLYFVTASRDILLGMYRESPKTLGDWGYTVNSSGTTAQVIIPSKIDDLIALAKLIMQKHNQDGSSSPLNVLDWSVLSQKLYDAEMKMEEARKANRDKETATQARNLALGTAKSQNSKITGTVKYLVTSIRDVLLGIFRGREQELGNWGFEVNNRSSKKGTDAPEDETPPSE